MGLIKSFKTLASFKKAGTFAATLAKAAGTAQTSVVTKLRSLALKTNTVPEFDAMKATNPKLKKVTEALELDAHEVVTNVAKSAATGKADDALMDIFERAVENINNNSNLGKTEAKGAAGAAGPDGKPLDPKGPKGADGADGFKKLAVVKLLIATLVVSIAAGIIASQFVQKAEREQAVCFASWVTKYHDLITNDDGTLLRIETPAEWTANMPRIEAKINALQTVQNDPVKAQAELQAMSDALMKCISKDTTIVGSTLKGIASDVGDAVGDIFGGVGDSILGALKGAVVPVLAIIIGLVVLVIVVLIARASLRAPDQRIEAPRRRVSGVSSASSARRFASRTLDAARAAKGAARDAWSAPRA